MTEEEVEIPPEALRSEITPFGGFCYCGQIHFSVNSDCMVLAALYCHCESCRRSHSSPLYHCVYVRPEDFQITQGEEHLSKFQKTPSTSVIRAFCSNCGSKVANYLTNKPWVGFFPATLREELQHNLPTKFCPTVHHCGDEAVLSLERLDPTLPVVKY